MECKRSACQFWKYIALFLFIFCNGVDARKECFSSIYSFGDSLADTGNLILTNGSAFFSQIMDLPYGQTYFKRSTGRCSNGRLVVDFIAEACRLQHLSPYLDKYADFSTGVNFAVVGATALNASFFQSLKISIPTPYSLDMQIQWFKEFKSRFCDATPDCMDHFEDALYMVGEIGGNDLNYPFFIGRSFEEVSNFVPSIVQKIREAIETLIQENANKFLVQGNLPIGCSPAYLTLHRSNSSLDFDDIGCLLKFNNFSQYGNHLLQNMLDDVRRKHPNVSIVYADYYGAAMEMLKNPKKYGLHSNVFRVCCGNGGINNFSPPFGCHRDTNLCPNPKQHFNWDGIHLTETVYKAAAEMYLDGTFTTPPLHSLRKSCRRFKDI